MKKIGDIITSFAVMAFILSICTIESLSVLSIVTMILSGSWIVAYGFVCEEERAREGRW